MELIINFFKKGGLILCLIALLNYSCETNQRTGGLEETHPTEGTADTFEGTETEMERRRERIAGNIEHEVSRIQSELDSLRQEIQTASTGEKSQIEDHILRLENDIENLEQQQSNLLQADPETLEQIDRNIQQILHDRIETQDLDRSVRGEGTSLDGPDLNRTGTRTGTEVDQQAPVEADEVGGQSPAVPTGP